MSEQNIPTGKYNCALVVGEDGIARFPITVGNTGELAIEVELYLYAKGAEEPFTRVKKIECIDAAKPANQGTDTTPYEFMGIALKALGAESDAAINDAVELGLASDDGVMVFPGTPKLATAEISYKAGRQGGSFMNVKIMAIKEVTEDARTKALEAVRARKAATAPQATPFASQGRGTPVAPPGARPSPFAPPTAGR